MKRKPVKVICVQFLNGRKIFFFGSVSAIFQKFSEEDLGCTEDYLRQVLAADNRSYLSSLAYFYRSRLITSGHGKVHGTDADIE